MVRIYRARDNNDLDDFQIDNDLKQDREISKRAKNRSEIAHHPQLDTNIDKQEMYDEGLSGMIDNLRSRASTNVISYTPNKT